MVQAACSSANTESPLTLGGATPEMLPSLKQRLVGGRRWHRRVAGPFRNAYGSGLLGRPRRRGTFTGQCGQPLCPGDATSHRVGPQPGTVVRAAAGKPGPPRRLRQVRERGLPTRPKRDASRATLAWPLRQRPLPFAAGCV